MKKLIFLLIFLPLFNYSQELDKIYHVDSTFYFLNIDSSSVISNKQNLELKFSKTNDSLFFEIISLGSKFLLIEILDTRLLGKNIYASGYIVQNISTKLEFTLFLFFEMYSDRLMLIGLAQNKSMFLFKLR